MVTDFVLQQSTVIEHKTSLTSSTTMQFNKNTFAAVIIAMVGFVWSPRVVSALHDSAGDGGGGPHDGLEKGIRVSNYSKKAERDDCIFGSVLSFGSFFRFSCRRSLFWFSLLCWSARWYEEIRRSALFRGVRF